MKDFKKFDVCDHFVSLLLEIGTKLKEKSIVDHQICNPQNLFNSTYGSATGFYKKKLKRVFTNLKFAVLSWANRLGYGKTEEKTML